MQKQPAWRVFPQILKMLAIIAMLCLCGIKLWNISLAYINGNEVKTEMQSYVPEGTEVPVPQPAQPGHTAPAVPGEPHSSSAAPGIAVTQMYPASPFGHNEADEGAPPVVNQFIVRIQEEINSDIIAWLRIPGTDIDYPVTSAQDNEFYLQHDIYKNRSQSGSLFTDYRCAREFGGLNTIIYGHNMKNRSMFGGLRNYSDAGYMEENGKGILYTSTHTYELIVFAYMVVPSDDPGIYSNPLSSKAFHDYIKENARIYREPEQTGKYLTMSTCSYEYEDARIAVMAIIH